MEGSVFVYSISHLVVSSAFVDADDAADQSNETTAMASMLMSATDPNNEETFLLEPLRDALALCMASIRGSHQKIFKVLPESDEANIKGESGEVIPLKLSMKIFNQLAKYLIRSKETNYTLLDKTETKYMISARLYYKKTLQPLDIVCPGEGKTVIVPSAEQAELNVLQRYKVLYNNSEIKGKEHLRFFLEEFGLEEYFYAIGDSSPVLIKKSDRTAYLREMLTNQAGTHTEPEGVTKFVTILENYPDATKKDKNLHEAVTMYYRVSTKEYWDCCLIAIDWTSYISGLLVWCYPVYA